MDLEENISVVFSASTLTINEEIPFTLNRALVSIFHFLAGTTH
jgi:type III secretion system FlhB-like substrate exporter